jgi:predicted ester cyclase
MRKIIFSMLLIAISTSVIFAQSKTNLKTKKGNKMETTQNKEIALNLSKSIMTGQWDKVNELLDDNFQYIGDGQPAINKQQYIYFMKEILSKGFTNMDMTFHRVICEGNMVAVDYTNMMDNTGEYFGIPATGKRIASTGQFMREIKNGKVVAEWQTTNTYGMMIQLGVIPAPKK